MRAMKAAPTTFLAIALVLAMALLHRASAAPPAANGLAFPSNYPTAFARLGVGIGKEDPAIHTAYANEAAAAIKLTEQLPYPNGSVILMEFANSIRSAMLGCVERHSL